MINIIIPTFQPDYYLLECLKSIQNQDFDFNNFSVTIILNGHKEPYYSQIKLWLKDFNFNFKLLYSESNGVSNARNLALDNTKAQFICFLDDDDILSTNYISSLHDLANNKGIIVANTYNFLDNISKTQNDYLTFTNEFSSKNLVKYRKYLSNACCKLIPMSIIGDNRFSPSLKKSEDAVFMFQISKNINSITSTNPDVTYYRRLRPDSASRKKYTFMSEIIEAYKIMISFSKVYFKSPANYSFLLYLTRLLAVIKRVSLTLRN